MLKQPDIYSNVPARPGIGHQRSASTWVEPTVVVVRPAAAPAPAPSSGIDEALLEILRSPALIGETVELAFRRKEAEMLALCNTLSPIESMQLVRRLEHPKAGDVLATEFSRLISERWQRIVRFLGDARRRAALAGRK